MSEEYVPSEVQENLVTLGLEKRKMNWFVVPGGGKTSCALTVLTLASAVYGVGKALVLMPKSVLDQRTWQNEIAKWDHTKHLTCNMIAGDPHERLYRLKKPAHLYLMSYTSLRWLVETLRPWPFDFVVADESDELRNAGTKMFKAFRRVQSQIQWYFNLTGTPTPNGILNLWSQQFMVDGGTRLESFPSHFLNKYTHIIYGKYKRANNVGAEEQILSRIADVTVSVTKEQVKQTPVDVIDVDIPLSAPERQAYEQLKKKAVLMLQGNGVITSVNAAAATTKLRQFCSGAVYANNELTGETFLHHVSDTRITRLKELVSTLSTPVIIGYSYIHELERILRALPHAQKMRDISNVERVWAEGQVRVMLIQYGSGSRGLNLQLGGHTFILYSPTWSLAAYEQLIARLARRGQKNTVKVFRFFSEDTIEVAMHQRLTDRASVQDTAREYFKLPVMVPR